MEMRRVSYSFRYIQEVLYINNNVPLCSSLEQNSAPIAFPAPGKITREGYRVWLTEENDLGLKRYMVAIGTQHYVVMIDPASFIDVIPFSSWRINAAIIGEAHHVVISGSEQLPPDVVALLKNTGNQHLEIDNTIYNIQSFPLAFF